MKSQKLVLIISYLVLIVIAFLLFDGCSAIPNYTARLELNTCGQTNAEVDTTTVQAVYPYMEINYDNGSIGISSSNLCFGLYIFNANRDTLYHRDFKVIGQNHIELFNLLKNNQ